jgi:putative transposase
MRAMGLRGIVRRQKARATTPDLVEAAWPNPLRVGGFTCVASWAALACVVLVVDARRIFGGRVARTARASFVPEAPALTPHECHPAWGGRRVQHRDRGRSCLALGGPERLAEAGIEPRVGSVGASRDNTLAGTTSGLFKAEVTHRRLLEPNGNVPPAEAEARYHAQMKVQALAA